MSLSADWSNCHAILKKGLAAAPEADRPSPPFHLGGPVPVCPALTQVALAVWCARALEPSLAHLKNQKASHFLAMLAGEKWGLLAKLGRGWTYVEGGRDDVLASVPDALFAEAMAAVKRRLG